MSNNGVVRGLGPLRQENSRIGEHLSNALIAEMVGQSQALHELISGVTAPGAGVHLFFPHDHCKRGISLPRQTQFVFHAGRNNSNFAWDAQNTTDWWAPDMEGGSYGSYDVSSGKRDNLNSSGLVVPASFHVYATPGIDTDNTAVSTNPCYLSVGVLCNPAAGCDLRLYNRTRQEAGATVTLGAVGANLTETTLTCPVRGGVMNHIDIEQKSATLNNTFTLYQIYFAETRTVSQPQTAGTDAYASAARP